MSGESSSKSHSIKIGDRFGMWTVVGEPCLRKMARQNATHYPCQCQCGAKKLVSGWMLLHGKTRSCRCVNTAHGESGCGQGPGRTRLYKVWARMIQRCTNPTSRAWKDYGGRGIEVCTAWRESFVLFRDFAMTHGYQDDLEIDRIDNDGHYEPGNVRWSTRSQQGRNNRRTHHLTAFGEQKCVQEWLEDPRCKVGYWTFYSRLRRGWDAEQAMTAPQRKKQNG